MPAIRSGTQKIDTVTPRPHRSELKATSYENVANTWVAVPGPPRVIT
jgi:hypothetical protein